MDVSPFWMYHRFGFVAFLTGTRLFVQVSSFTGSSTENSLKTVLSLNRAYQAVVRESLQRIELALHENKERQVGVLSLVECNGSGVELRTLDYENPGSNPGCGVKTLGSFFTLHCSSSLS